MSFSAKTSQRAEFNLFILWNLASWKFAREPAANPPVWNRRDFRWPLPLKLTRNACNTLRENRPDWNILETSVAEISGVPFRGIDLLAGGVPCPPFSIAGKQLGSEDERDLFPEALRLVEEARPAAVLLENVAGFASKKFEAYRRNLIRQLLSLGYETQCGVMNACWFGVPQLRPRFILVAFKDSFPGTFVWPEANHELPPSVGDSLIDLMSARNWRGAAKWQRKASGIGPTLVGGSKKHGGPDLGPTRARKQWARAGSGRPRSCQ